MDLTPTHKCFVVLRPKNYVPLNEPKLLRQKTEIPSMRIP